MDDANKTRDELIKELAALRQRIADMETVTTLQKGAEQALRDSLQSASDIVAAIPSGLFIYQFEPPDRLILMDANPEAERLTGISIDEWRGAEFDRIWPQAAELGIKDSFLSPIRTGQVYDSENVVYQDSRLQGNYRVRTFLMPGERLGVAFEDVTKQRQADEALKTSERAYRRLAENSTDIIMRFDRDLRFLYVNPVIKRLDGREPSEFVGKSIRYLGYSNELLDMLESTGRKVFETGKREQIEYSLPYRGREVTLSSTIVPEWDVERQVVSLLVTTRDITRLVAADIALQESEARFRAMFEQAAVGVSQVEISSGRFVRINQRHCDIVGYTMEEMEALDFQTITHPDDLQEDLDNTERIIRGEIDEFSMEKRYIHKDGSPVWVNLTVSPMLVPGAAPEYNIAVVQDITARKLAEAANKESEDRFQALVERGFDGIFIHRDFHVLEANQQMADILGRGRDDLLVDRSDLWVTPSSREKIAAYIRSGSDHIYEVDFLHQDGSTIHAEVFGVVCRYQGQPARIVGVRDITANKQALIALKESEQKFKIIAEESLQGILIITNSGIVYANPVFEELMGITLDDLHALPRQGQIGRAHPDDAESVLTYYRDLLAGKTISHNFEYRRITGEGAVRWIEARSAKIDYFGEPALLSFYMDISERKEAEEVLRLSDEIARKALEEKTALLKELNHRAKNNLQVVAALLDLQAVDVDDSIARAALSETSDRIHSMALVHEKLYRSLDLDHVNLADYIRDLALLLMQGYTISKQKIDLDLDLEDVFVKVDTAMPCGLILNELVTNALKYAFPENGAGRISVRLRRLERGQVFLRVADNGVGLPPGFDIHTDGSLGMRIILSLAENQLKGGMIDFAYDKGVVCELRFQGL